MEKLSFEVRYICSNVPEFIGKYEEELKILFINKIYKNDENFIREFIEKAKNDLRNYKPTLILPLRN